MIIKNMFVSDINRHIDKVVKVDQTKEDLLYQEITEYVITKEIRRNFNDFFSAYEKSIDEPNDNIGVWISGFFGSGKSHFLKMLTYILTNKQVNGKPTIEYFKEKFGDPMMYSIIEKCVKKHADAILFDIFYVGASTGGKLDLVTVFAKQFYDYLGYYGSDLKVARFEKFLDDQKKYDIFKEKFEIIHGTSWIEARDAFSFFEDDIVEAMMKTLSCSESTARNWFNSEETIDFNVEKLTDEIKKYVESKGKDFRLLFMIDEMGMYVGDSTENMITLQAIVQQLGVKCNGQVWVMVTGQEAIDSVIKVKGSDLSKILARFDIKLKLSSSSVDEVIKKRILGKTDAAKDTLKMLYYEKSTVLKNLFTFDKATLDLKGYTNEENFIETYPFVSYQFIIEQSALQSIRVSGFAGTSFSSGERTMLAAFQLAARDIQEKDEFALVPFYHFYSIVEQDLDHQIRIVFERCSRAAENQDGVEPFDVNVLKLLFLIRNIKDFPHNIENITTLMVDDIRTDKINLRTKITKSLERLLNQNYISRNGDNYDFLTDDEQEIAREIRAITVDSAQIINKIGEIIFSDLYVSKKFKYGKYDIDFDKIIDDTNINTPTNGIKLRIITQASDLYSAGESAWLMRSSNHEAFVILNSEYKYFEELENATKIMKYAKTRNVSQLPEAIQSIIREKNQQANLHTKTARSNIEKAIINATFIVNGQKVEARGSTLKDRLEYILTYLVESVYSEMPLMKYFYDSDDQILRILSNDGFNLGAELSNKDAINKIETYLELQQSQLLPTSMADILKRYQAIPYGWREIDIASCVAELIKQQKVQLKVSGNIISPFSKEIVNYLRKKSEIDRVIVEKRINISDEIIKKTRNILKDYLNTMDVPLKEDDLAQYIIQTFTTELKKLEDIISQYDRGKYPQKHVVENIITIYRDILSRQKDNENLFNSILHYENELFDNQEEFEDIKSFFENQRKVFDDGVNKLIQLKDEKTYLDSSKEAKDAYEELNCIILMERPYTRLREIPNYIQEIDKVYNLLLSNKKIELEKEINKIKNNLNQYLNENNKPKLEEIEKDLDFKLENISKMNKLTVLDATKSYITSWEEKYIKELLEVNNKGENSSKIKVIYVKEIINSKLINKNNLDEYVNSIKEKLLELLEDNDEINII